MNQQHAQHPSQPATLWDAVDALNGLRDALVELALELHDLQFELEDDRYQAARERALLYVANARSGNAPRRES
ncbi:MAG TPA: hypothetical protein PLB25_06275 [Rhodoferax sp.]|nr:hypothetical protein [Rhodoferax sp.]